MNIEKRQLTEKEIKILLSETKNFPDVGLYSKSQWKKFPQTYIIQEKNKFIGVCAVIPIKRWYKIGPLVIIKKYQGYGYGKELLNYIANNTRKINVYIGSSNIRVHKIIRELDFRQLNGFSDLPNELKKFLIIRFFKQLSLHFILDAFPKLFQKSGKYYYFIRKNSK